MGKGTVLAFDYGTKRTGVASGELEIGVAHPLMTLEASSRAARFAAIDKLVKEWQPGLLVVGLPLHPDGGEHELTRAARNFAAELEKRYKLPVFLHDERYTSAAVESDMQTASESGVESRHLESRHGVDARAAQLILQGFFDERATA
jgi:putative Holliday junction resolvase